MSKPRKPSIYREPLRQLFFSRWKEGLTEVEFSRLELQKAAKRLDVQLPANPYDPPYSAKHRGGMPPEIRETAPAGLEWVLEGAGSGRYAFRLIPLSTDLAPRADREATKIPDATPEIISKHVRGTEQALLAKVRYNRLIDIFLRVTAFSLQSHLASTIKVIRGDKKVYQQVEIDEMYVAVNRDGTQFAIPVQAKGGTDKMSASQMWQSIKYCEQKMPDLICRAVATQFMADGRIALLEVTLSDDEVKVRDEAHYKLVPADAIDKDELANYRMRYSL